MRHNCGGFGNIRELSVTCCRSEIDRNFSLTSYGRKDEDKLNVPEFILF